MLGKTGTYASGRNETDVYVSLMSSRDLISRLIGNRPVIAWTFVFAATSVHQGSGLLDTFDP
jgi:hypothetical protein